jgi:CheY-like chemotaxis protein
MEQNKTASKGSKVLVIDDDDVAREAMCDILKRAGYQVSDLRSPIGASREILANNINVVVIDVIMPALRGDRLAKLLRGNPKFDKLGVVLVSGDVTVQLRQLAKEVRAVAVVDKSNIRTELVSAINSAVNLSPDHLES